MGLFRNFRLFRLPYLITYPSRRLPFITPLAFILFLVLTFYFLSHLFYYSLTNTNYLASTIRDNEELRVAEAWTMIAKWRDTGRFLPFHYNRNIINRSVHHYSRLRNPPNVVFSILLPNRRNHQSDNYVTAYGIESVVQLLNAIDLDVARYGQRFASINITVCPTTDNLVNFSELKEIRPLLPVQAIKPRPQPLDGLSLTCRTVIDFAHCISQSTKGLSESTYMVLFEDDMVMERQGINQLWQVFSVFEESMHQKTADENSPTGSPLVLPGLVQLHTPTNEFRYNLFDFTSLLELLSVSAVLCFLLFAIWLRHWYRSFVFQYNVLLVGCTFVLCMFFVILVGRAKWLITWHRMVHHQSVRFAQDPSAPATGASLLIPVKLARDLASFLNTHSCDELERRVVASKAALIARYISNHNHDIWTTIPNLFKHRGLYSLYKNDMVNPYMVE